MVTIYLLLTWCWRPLNRLAGWFLIPLGQRSLYTFILHVYIVLAVSQLVTFDLSAPGVDREHLDSCRRAGRTVADGQIPRRRTLDT